MSEFLIGVIVVAALAIAFFGYCCVIVSGLWTSEGDPGECDE